MAVTQIRGSNQVKNYTVTREKLVVDFLGGVDWDLTNGAKNATIKGLKDATLDDSPATLAQLNAALAGLHNGMEYKGGLDLSTSPETPNLTNADIIVGDFYKITGAGSIDGVAFDVNDNVYFKNDVPSGTAPTAADFDKIDNTESPDIVRTGDIVDNLSSSGVTDAPLSANQGYVLDQKIQALDAQVNVRIYGESLVVTTGSATVSDLANTPVSGTVRVYFNGIRVAEGASNDYTISGKTITFNFPLVTGDTVLVDYEYAN